MPTDADTDTSNGHGLIDRVYDGLDKFVTGAGAVLGVDVNATSTPPAAPERTLPAGAATPASGDAAARPMLPAPKPAPRPFEIVEVLGRGGSPISWIVTNGHEKAECASPEIARAVLELLARKGAPVSRPEESNGNGGKP